MSKTTVANEFDRDSLQEYNKLGYLEFLEFLVRVAELYFEESEMNEPCWTQTIMFAPFLPRQQPKHLKRLGVTFTTRFSLLSRVL